MIKRVIFCMLILAGAASGATMGMDRAAYGVFDRSGWNTTDEFPFTIGQYFQSSWGHVNPATNTFDWSELDAQLQFAYEQNQMFCLTVNPQGHNPGDGPPEWVYSAGVPRIDCPRHTYGYWLDPEFQTYLSEMYMALGHHLRNEVPTHLQELIAFIRVNTGTGGDESPYENNYGPPSDEEYIATNYPHFNIDKNGQDWRDYRLWLFDVYDQAFQEGPGRKIPLIFQSVTPDSNPTEWNWCATNITDGLGTKYAGAVRGHHINGAQNVTDNWKHLAVDSSFGLISKNEMDQTWSKPFFQLNIRLGMYWCAVEQTHPGLSIWDVTQSCLDNTHIDDYAFAFEFFNKWAAERVPATAGGGFCILHEGLDSADTVKFPEGTYGNASKSNTNRYAAICAAYSSQGARMDDLNGATTGQVSQRRVLTGFNDAGWEIVPGNYERFITQIDPDNTSIGLWRIVNGVPGGNISATEHPYSRFARGFHHSSGKNTMYFDVHDDLMCNPGQAVQLSVIYCDNGTGSFELQYDAADNIQKTAFVVNKTGSNTWKTNSVVVTDGLFENNGPNGADLMLLNVDSDDDIFHMIEIQKLADVYVGTDGQGQITARHGSTTYNPASGVYMEGQRLDLTPVPEPGWSFSHWSGDVAASRDDWARIYPVEDTRVTAHFVYDGTVTASDDFETGGWSGGSGWSGAWALSGGTAVENDGALGGLVAHLTQNGRITRTAGTPVSSARLDFDFEIKSVDSGESVQAEVYDGSWHTVWSKTSPADETSSESIDLSAYGTVSQVRFTLNASGSADHLYIDNVTLSGDGGGSEPTNPEFSSDPFEMASAEIGVSYTGSITNRAADPDGDPMSFSKLSGPGWLTVATNGTLSGTPSSTDIGLNSWTVEVDDNIDGSDTALLLINVSTNPSPVETAPYFVADPFSKSDALAAAPYREFISNEAADPDQQALRFDKLSGPEWLNIETNGMVWGTPALSDFGGNTFSVRVSDTDGYSDFADLEIQVNAQGSTAFFQADFAGSQAQDGLVTQSNPTPDPYGGVANLNAGTAVGTWSAGSLLGSSVYTNLNANNVLFAGTGGYALTANLSASAMLAGTIRIDLNYAICRTGNNPDRRNFITGLDETNQELFKIRLSGNSGDDGGKTLYLETGGTNLLLASGVARAAVNNFQDSGMDQLEIGLSTNGISIALNSTELTNGVALLSATDHLSKLLFEGDSMWYDNLSVSTDFGGEPVRSYGIWAGAHALEQLPVGDDDDDGLSNLAEYALNGNPTNATETGLVEVQVDGSMFTFVHASNVVDSSLVYRLLDRTNLVSGVVHTNHWDAQTISLPADGYATVSNHYAVGEQEHRFIQLHVEQQ